MPRKIQRGPGNRAAARDLGWGATRAWQAEARLRAAGSGARIRFNEKGAPCWPCREGARGTLGRTGNVGRRRARRDRSYSFGKRVFCLHAPMAAGPSGANPMRVGEGRGASPVTEIKMTFHHNQTKEYAKWL